MIAVILLVAIWKAWTVPILIVLGISGFLIRVLIEMTDNWETGYGPGSRRAYIQAWVILGFFILSAAMVGFFM